MMPNLEIIIGTYEEFLLGYKMAEKEEGHGLVQSFADKSHSGAIKCVATNGRYVATGGSDDRIFIYDMETRKQTQILLSHEGTVNALAFTPDKTHVFSGGSDGSMIATRLGSWIKEAFWKKAHDGAAVTEISCHPSGKLALSLGADLTLRTWNLVKGRVAYKTNLKSRQSLGRLAECVIWSPSGSHFTITGQRILEIWSIEKADVIKAIQTQSRPTCVRWIGDEYGLLGMENGKLLWFSLKADFSKENVEVNAHDARVKAMDFLKATLVTASSSGEIKVWQVDSSKFKLISIASVNIGCRPTCLCLLDLEPFASRHQERRVSQESEQLKKVVATNEKESKDEERGVVTIEYEDEDAIDNDSKPEPQTASKKKSKKTKAKKEQNQKNEHVMSRYKKSAESENEESQEDDDSIDDDFSETDASDCAPPSKKKRKQFSNSKNQQKPKRKQK